jgi:predicted nucleotide-binding protein
MGYRAEGSEHVVISGRSTGGESQDENMPTKRKIVAEFTRDELWQAVDEHDLPVEDRRKLDDLQRAVRRLSKPTLREVLLGFDRDRLKGLCRTLGIDDSGKRKAAIVDRLVVVRNGDDDDESDTEDIPRPVGLAQLLPEISRDELWGIVDRHDVHVEDRRKLDDLYAALRRLPTSALRESLLDFERDRLKEICRRLGLDDSGRAKEDLVARLVGDDSTVNTVDDHRDSGAKQPRPRLFIGSTTEAIQLAREVQAELDHEVQATVWTQNLFTPGDPTWSRLVEMARTQFDFALFVFSGDDIVESRGAATRAPRDNVLLEYGLFVGAVGPDRTFFLFNRDHRPKIASDLAGVTALEYGDRDDGNQQAAVGPACTRLIKQCKRLGRLADHAADR